MKKIVIKLTAILTYSVLIYLAVFSFFSLKSGKKLVDCTVVQVLPLEEEQHHYFVLRDNLTGTMFINDVGADVYHSKNISDEVSISVTTDYFSSLSTSSKFTFFVIVFQVSILLMFISFLFYNYSLE